MPESKPGPAQRQDLWRIIGPGGGGTMIAPTISPHDPSLVVEHCDMTGAYITADGGNSWRMFNLRTVVRTFAFDPSDPNVIYAGNIALWRSEDRGRTWRMIWPDPTRNTVEHMRGDHASPVLTTDDPTYPGSGGYFDIATIAVDPASSAHIYVGVGPSGEQPSAIYVSGDRGASWSRLETFGRERPLLLLLRSDATHGPPSACLVTDSGVHRADRGTWRRATGPDGGIAAISGGWEESANSPHLWAAGRGGISLSADGGDTWRGCTDALLRDAGLPVDAQRPRFRAIACCETRPGTAYVGFLALRQAHGSQPCNGIAKTEDGGKRWIIAHRECAQASDNLEGSWVEKRAVDGGHNIWFDSPYSLGVAPNDARVCYATDLFRTYRTLDGGDHWQQVNSVQLGQDRWTTRGLDVTTCYGVHHDPFDSKHLYITYTDIGLFRSPDGGKSWIGATEGIPSNWRNTTYWIELDPAVRGLLWGAFGFNHDLPRPKMWRNQDQERYEGGVAVSNDGGRTWALSNGGIPETAVTHILLDTASPVGNRTLYACAFGRGVYKSTDNGRTWTLKNEGIQFRQPFAWRITRSDEGALYLVIARRAESGPVSAEEMGAVYRSTDGANHWERLPLPKGVTGPTGLTVDPSDRQRLYLTAWGLGSDEVDDTGGGVFLSTDGGQTWRLIFDHGQHVYDLTLDPNNPRTLYVCGFDAAAWRSTDRGETWSRLQGYNFKWGHRVVPDPVNKGKVYVTTFGGSVWHGPAEGDPHAVEDIVGPLEWRR